MVRVSQTPYHFELKEIQFKLIFCFISINSALICAGQSVTNVCSICTCDQYQTSIYCFNRTLTSVPKAIPATVESLNLSSNRMANIERDAFKDLINLKTLDLRMNQITNIEKDAFKDLINLNYIDLRGNQMANIENDAFKDLINLNYIDLRENNMTSIENDTFKNLIYLNYIDLSYNEITNIEKDAFENLTNLKTLYLGWNELTNIEEDTFKNPVNLVHLYMGENKLTNFEEDTFKGLVNLKYLDLSWNRMTNIEKDAFKNLINLKTLYLGGNEFTNIEEDTFKNLVNLKNLYLNKNNLTNIEEDIFKNLVNLEYLNLKGNQIKTYEDGAFLFLPSIITLDLRHNYNMTCGCHLPAIEDYLKRTYNRSVDVQGKCRNNQMELIPILEYSECKDYSLFQWKLQCQTCSGITCNDSEVTRCPGAEPVCMNRISMSGVTLMSDKSCSTYTECVAAKKNNTFPCNKLTNGTSCVTCLTGHLCNKNDFIDAIEAHCDVTPNTQLKSAPKVKGNIHIVQQTSEVRVYMTLTVFDADNPKEVFVLHIHEFNDTSESCDSLGGHFNPYSHQHGVAKKPHVCRDAGGWGNVVANSNGIIVSQFGDKNVSLRGPDSIIGRSIVLKAKADDKGDSGERLACCVIIKVNKPKMSNHNTKGDVEGEDN